MKATHAAIGRGLAKFAHAPLVKIAHVKEARRRWLEDDDLIKLCRLFKEKHKAGSAE